MFKNMFIYKFLKIQQYWFMLMGVAGAIAFQQAPGIAQVSADNTLPDNTQVTGTGNIITIEGGTQRQSNLFHSFKEFSVTNDGTAFFNNGLDIQNIFSRVTGNSVSNIDGLIKANGTANLFLINPNGIVFGKNASLDVGGSFFASTASNVKFADGVEFSAVAPQNSSLLTVSVPLGLQFGSNPNSITSTNSFLAVKPGKALGLLGGDINLEGSIIFAPSGRIEVGSVADNSFVSITPNNTDYVLGYEAISNFQDIRLRQEALVTTIGENGGTIKVQGKNVTLTDGSLISANLTGAGTSGGLTINASESVQVAGESEDGISGLQARVRPTATGKAGNLTINTPTLIVKDGAQISTGVFGAGTGGNLNVNASKGIQIIGTTINGQIPSGLYSETLASGNAGDTVLNTSVLLVSDGAQINSGTRSTGKGGNLTIDASKEVQLTGTGLFSYSGLVVSSQGTGNAGNLTVNTPTLLVQDGAGLIASSTSNGNAGNITINASERVSFNQAFAANRVLNGTGKGGDINIYTSNLELLNSFIRTNSLGEGDAGNIIINASDKVFINDSIILSWVNSNVNSTASRKAGNIQINAKSAEFNNIELDASLFGLGESGNIILNIAERANFKNSTVASVIGKGGQGKGGNIKIDAGYLNAINTNIATETQGKGVAGNITLDVHDRISLSRYSSVTSKIQKDGEGQAGNVSISTGFLEISQSSQVSSATFGQGNAGNIRIEARDGITIKDMLVIGLVLNGIFTTVEEGAKGQAGEIRISTGFLELLNGAMINSSTDGVGNAGNIIIEARDRIFSNSEYRTFEEGLTGFINNTIVNSVGSTAQGNAGDINISTGSFEALNNTDLNSKTSGVGNAGKIVILAREQMILNDSFILTGVTQKGIGRGGDVNIFTGSLEILNSANIDTSTFGDGDAGNIKIIATQPITIAGLQQKREVLSDFFADEGKSSAIFSTTGDNPAVPGTGPIIVGKGKGGDINITAPLLTVSDGAVIDARTFNNKPGGNINLTLGNLQILNGGQIFTTSEGAGAAGTITIDADNEVNIAGTDPTYFSRLNEFPNRVAPVSPKSGVYVRATDTGSAGNIFLNTPNLKLDNQGTINAESEAVDGGNINLNVQNLLLMRRNSSISTNAGTAQKGGNGGNVNINSKYIVAFPSEDSDISANAFQGSGGRVEINSQGIFGIESRLKPTNKSDITASSEQGISGVTVIDAPETSSIQNSFTELPSTIDTNALIANTCISRSTEREENSFTVTGSGALRNAPGDGVNSVYSTGDVRSFVPASRSWKKGDSIVEPQGVYRLPDGQLLLSRSC